MSRLILSGPTILYVDRVNGSDTTGDGSAAHPWRTIQFAVLWIKREIDFALQSLTLQLVGSGYTERVVIATHPVGHHVFTIRGDPATPTNCLWVADTVSNQPLVSVTDYGAVTLDGLELGSYVTGTVLVNAWQHSIVDLQNVLYGSCVAGTMLLAGDGSKINFTGPQTIDGNAAVFANAQGGVIEMGSVSVDMPHQLSFDQFAAAALNGKVSRTAGFSGAGAGACVGKQYSVGPAGVLSIGAVTLPGNVAGTNDRGVVC